MSRLLRGLSITLLTRGLLLIIGLASSIILARWLGPQGRGVYALIILIPALFQFLGGLGLEAAATYLVARHRAEARAIALTLIVASLLLGAVLIAAYAALQTLPAFAGYLAATSLDPDLVWILVALLPATIASSCASAALLGLERYRLYNLATLIMPTVTLALLIGLVVAAGLGLPGAVASAALGQLAGFAGGGAIVLTVAPGRPRWAPLVIGDALRYGWKVYVAQVAWFLHNRSDMFLVGYLAGPVALGYYATAVGLAEKLNMPPSAVGTVLFPRVAAGPGTARDLTAGASRHTLWLTLILAVLLAAVAWPLIDLLYGVDFLPAVGPFWLLLPGIVSISVGRVLSSDLNGRGLPGAVARANGLALALNVGLNLWWIPIWGASGAAAATTVSYGVAVLFLARRYLRESRARWADLLVLSRTDMDQLTRRIRSLLGRRPSSPAQESGS
ncbi:MAG: oligosaccharide flippase family protein [Gemmatimonadetes bacterium]|uniref:Oligosaccharide flippase family protein n=1 Tax=Candidatus Kutchimonas denitrificans TaxID=3056748 RepID=A0AAE4ZAI0_9BACT|nr:oligosaccharide flippase family protein [Gemmatimonadota bacterium]NIR73825.1 oligosaccharide flippase family protein [Candidatus Kutchimonas denitrificans]NIS00098.1 oligosaccharide flippase family protein [Gemmatimonadota bacterium]NIT65687.1 oligosaccharide flippase family protein [Gemmatimonadota bacterium]NIU53135.1 oligosaccharide flippase family protein [Gemmatimonadota bacterium]